jgi:hypothetical protein
MRKQKNSRNKRPTDRSGVTGSLPKVSAMKTDPQSTLHRKGKSGLLDVAHTVGRARSRSERAVQPKRRAPREKKDFPNFLEWARNPHFIIAFDDSMGVVGENLADAVHANCERDFARLRDLFGSLTVPGMPFTVRLQETTDNINGSHSSCGDTELTCNVNRDTDGEATSFLVVAEADEVFMAAQNAGWNCGASNGEALSRVLAAELHPAGLGAFTVIESFWLASPRGDFVTHTDPTDTNPESVGCGVLFINFLRFQLNIGLRAIIASGGSTLEDCFHSLTSKTDGFGPFSLLLARFFPNETSSRGNPFPLFFVDNFYTTDPIEHDSLLYSAVPCFRMFSTSTGDHFYTTDPAERDNASVQAHYRFEGTGFFLAPHPGSDTVPLFRLFNPLTHDHLYTTSELERHNAVELGNYLSEGTAGHVVAVQRPHAVSLFRLFKRHTGDHFYTTSAAERDHAVAHDGYVDEGVTGFVHAFPPSAAKGVACHVFSQNGLNTQPVFRLRSITTIDHFYTMSQQEREHAIQHAHYVDEGIAFFAFPAAIPGSAPLFRLFKSATGDHLYTTSADERDRAKNNEGYSDEGILGHVFLQPGTNTVPLLRVLRQVLAFA